MRPHRAPSLYRRGKSGTWWCYWQDERWSTGTTIESDAARIVRERYDPRVATSREKVVEDAILLVYEALDRRVNAQGKPRSDSTKKNARDKLGHFARLWSNRPLSEIDCTELEKYVSQREKEGVKRLTVSHEIGYWRQAWKLARSKGWVARSWDELMPERFERGYVPKTRWLTPNELHAVLKSLPAEQAAIVAWLVATGSDLGDIARAQAEDLDWKRGLVRVRGTKTFFRDRYVPITELSSPLLKLAGKHGPPFAPWPGINGALRRLARLLGIAHFSPKDLRRTHGQWLRSGGVPPHLIGRVLGHADSQMADRIYAQGDELAIARLVRLAVAQSKDTRTSIRTTSPREATRSRKSRRVRVR